MSGIKHVMDGWQLFQEYGGGSKAHFGSVSEEYADYCSGVEWGKTRHYVPILELVEALEGMDLSDEVP